MNGSTLGCDRLTFTLPKKHQTPENIHPMKALWTLRTWHRTVYEYNACGIEEGK
jgi:hypothetical protein